MGRNSLREQNVRVWKVIEEVVDRKSLREQNERVRKVIEGMNSWRNVQVEDDNKGMDMEKGLHNLDQQHLLKHFEVVDMEQEGFQGTNLGLDNGMVMKMIHVCPYLSIKCTQQLNP